MNASGGSEPFEGLYLGHRDHEAIHQVVGEDMSTGVEIRKCNIQRACECCAAGEFSRHVRRNRLSHLTRRAV